VLQLHFLQLPPVLASKKPLSEESDPIIKTIGWAVYPSSRQLALVSGAISDFNSLQKGVSKAPTPFL
jgi:hypothetical protein